MFDFSFLPQYLPYFTKGLAYTLLLSICSVLVAILPALGLALMRLSKHKLPHKLAGMYIAVFRSTPIIVQLYIIYYGLFNAIRLPTYYLLGFVNIAMFIPGVLTLALNSAAYVAEIIRAGIQAVDAGQSEAARSLGLTKAQTMAKVVLPQAVKNILPALGNEVVTMVKESSICSFMGMQDLMWGAKAVITATFLPMSPYLFTAAIYFLINYPASQIIGKIEARMRRSDIG